MLMVMACLNIYIITCEYVNKVILGIVHSSYQILLYTNINSLAIDISQIKLEF